MINGLGIVGWGVGGIEAEAGMLGQPVYFLTPDVVGVHLTGALREGVTATDVALTVTQLLRKAKDDVCGISSMTFSGVRHRQSSRQNIRLAAEGTPHVAAPGRSGWRPSCRRVRPCTGSRPSRGGAKRV